MPRGGLIVILPWTTRRSATEETTNTTPPLADERAVPTLAEAFHDLHGSSLLGFGLLVSLGNGRLAEQAAGEALAAGAHQASALRHPERAAAWLRARVVSSLHRHDRAAVIDAERWTALASLGVEEPVYEGLAALSVEARAALVASAIERFEAIDVETILGANPSATRRLVAQARARYVAAAGDRPSDEPGGGGGPLATRIQSVASRAMTSEASR